MKNPACISGIFCVGYLTTDNQFNNSSSSFSNIFNVSVDYIIENSDIRMPAESLMQTGSSADEIELPDLFREMDAKERQRAIGILFALKNYNE